MISFFDRYSLYIAWLIACIGTLGSIYFSEIKDFPPCHLCWYQRICLDPLAIILGIAVWKGSVTVIPYVMPQVIIGIFFAAYEAAIQELPGWHPLDLCGTGPSCTTRIDIGLGPITLPILSLIALILLALLLFWAWKRHGK